MGYRRRHNGSGVRDYPRCDARQTRKYAYCFYRANWSTQPTLHLVGRRYADRAYAVTHIKAYSNAAQARILLNGNEIGLAPRPLSLGNLCDVVRRDLH